MGELNWERTKTIQPYICYVQILFSSFITINGILALFRGQKCLSVLNYFAISVPKSRLNTFFTVLVFFSPVTHVMTIFLSSKYLSADKNIYCMPFSSVMS